MSATPGPPAQPDAALAYLRALALRSPRPAYAIVVDLGLLAELFRQRDALAAELEKARADLERFRLGPFG